MTSSEGLLWSDEFDGPRGTAVDARYWTHELGGGGWGNRELQRYTDRPENAALDGNGNLAIVARREAGEHTSARLITHGKLELTYGRVEARMRLPRGRGIWPAFWMLGANLPATPWPGCGEIDIVENLGHEPRIIHGTVHGPGYSGRHGIARSYEHPVDLADDFHVYGVDWQRDRVSWLLDGRVYGVLTVADLGGHAWVHDHPFFILLNLAIGGDWPGDPDESTPFPATLLVDYVRVYRAVE
jgi:beta-glucanase (GH16 family)